MTVHTGQVAKSTSTLTVQDTHSPITGHLSTQHSGEHWQRREEDDHLEISMHRRHNSSLFPHDNHPARAPVTTNPSPHVFRAMRRSAGAIALSWSRVNRRCAPFKSSFVATCAAPHRLFRLHARSLSTATYASHSSAETQSPSPSPLPSHVANMASSSSTPAPAQPSALRAPRLSALFTAKPSVPQWQRPSTARPAVEEKKEHAESRRSRTHAPSQAAQGPQVLNPRARVFCFAVLCPAASVGEVVYVREDIVHVEGLPSASAGCLIRFARRDHQVSGCALHPSLVPDVCPPLTLSR